MSVTDTAAGAAVTGASAMLVGMLGVEPQAIIWAIVGSIIGVALAPPTGRLYAIALFVAATMTCALIATLISAQYFAGAPLPRNVAAVLLAAGFHPIFKKFIERAGELVGAWIDRFAAAIGGQGNGGPK